VCRNESKSVKSKKDDIGKEIDKISSEGEKVMLGLGDAVLTARVTHHHSTLTGEKALSSEQEVNPLIALASLTLKSDVQEQDAAEEPHSELNPEAAVFAPAYPTNYWCVVQENTVSDDNRDESRSITGQKENEDAISTGQRFASEKKCIHVKRYIKVMFILQV
jgi:hypothetical protein